MRNIPSETANTAIYRQQDTCLLWGFEKTINARQLPIDPTRIINGNQYVCIKTPTLDKMDLPASSIGLIVPSTLLISCWVYGVEPKLLNTLPNVTWSNGRLELLRLELIILQDMLLSASLTSTDKRGKQFG